VVVAGGGLLIVIRVHQQEALVEVVADLWSSQQVESLLADFCPLMGLMGLTELAVTMSQVVEAEPVELFS